MQTKTLMLNNSISDTNKDDVNKTNPEANINSDAEQFNFWY